MATKILVDSACDIDPKDAAAISVDVIPLRVSFAGVEYLDNVNLTHDEFFIKLIETDELPTTSQISPYDYEEKFRELTANGDSLVCITLSSKLSGSYNNACMAAEDFGGKVLVVDSLNACLGERILVEYASRLRDKGMNAEEIAAELDSRKKDIRLIALLDTLEYLKKGGRISSAVAFAGNLLSIKPVIAVEDGEISLLGKARGSKAANNKLHELIEAETGIDYNMPACLAYSGLSDAMLNKYVEDHKDLYDRFPDKLPVTTLGCTIGTHIGPGAIGVAFFVV